MVFLFLAVIIINIYLFVRRSQTNKSMSQIREDFWAREHKANLTTRKDLSDLDFIIIPMEDLPFDMETLNKELKSIQDEIIALSNQPMVNFTGLSNTDLKLKYGAANIKELIRWDTNFIALVTLLNEWGLYYYKQHQYNSARQIFEFAVDCKSDVSNTYILLANIYVQENISEKIDDLIQVAESLDSLAKNKILKSLRDLKYESFLY